MLNVKKVNYEEDYISGCETCDYGSSYINKIEIILEDNTSISIELSKMYSYVLSKVDYMKLISNNDTIDEFILKTLALIKKRKSLSIDWLLSLEDFSIMINGKNINIKSTLRNKKIKFER
mgnify:CR=1 FL=1